MKGLSVKLHTFFVVMILVLVACGEADDAADDAELEDDANGEVATDPDDEAQEPEPGDDDSDLQWSFGQILDPAHPHIACGAHPLSERLQDNGISLEVFTGGALGSEAEMLEQVALGELEMSMAGAAFLGEWYEPVQVLDAAFLFRDADHLESVLSGEVGQDLWEGLRQEAGIRVLGAWYLGTRHVTANVPVRHPDDLAGVALRAPDAPLNLANVRALGAEPTPVEFGELYLALQQGVVDGQENPIPTISAGGFHEVQDYISLTGHHVQGVMVLVSEQAWEQLPEDQQSALADHVDALAGEVQDCIENGEIEILEQWQAEGLIEVVEDVDRDAFREKVSEELPPQFDWEDLYYDIQAAD